MCMIVLNVHLHCEYDSMIRVCNYKNDLFDFVTFVDVFFFFPKKNIKHDSLQ